LALFADDVTGPQLAAMQQHSADSERAPQSSPNVANNTDGQLTTITPADAHESVSLQESDSAVVVDANDIAVADSVADVAPSVERSSSLVGSEQAPQSSPNVANNADAQLTTMTSADAHEPASLQQSDSAVVADAGNIAVVDSEAVADVESAPVRVPQSEVDRQSADVPAGKESRSNRLSVSMYPHQSAKDIYTLDISVENHSENLLYMFSAPASGLSLPKFSGSLEPDQTRTWYAEFDLQRPRVPALFALSKLLQVKLQFSSANESGRWGLFHRSVEIVLDSYFTGEEVAIWHCYATTANLASCSVEANDNHIQMHITLHR